MILYDTITYSNLNSTVSTVSNYCLGIEMSKLVLKSYSSETILLSNYCMVK